MEPLDQPLGWKKRERGKKKLNGGGWWLKGKKESRAGGGVQGGYRLVAQWAMGAAGAVGV